MSEAATIQGEQRVARIEVHRTIIRADGRVEEKGLSAVFDRDPERMAADVAAIGDSEGRGRVTPAKELLEMSPEEVGRIFGLENVTVDGKPLA